MIEDCREAAHRIGIDLAREALWSGSRCNWFAPVYQRFDADQELCGGTLGPGLYDGTAGVALFLARLHQATGDRLMARTAAGAIEHALSRSADVPAALRSAFYTGCVGIGFAAADVGTRLNRDDLSERGLALVGGTMAPDSAPRPKLDVMSGAAGTIPALLRLHAARGDAAFLEAARRHGAVLVARARRDGAAASWDTTAGLADEVGDGDVAWLAPAAAARRHLTGYSHGASGIALALQELAHATGEDDLLVLAREGYAYEDATWDPTRDRWPDLRCGDGEEGCDAAWCHGAVGIGLARARSFVLTGDERDRDAVRRALRVTVRGVAKRLGKGENFSLCHGVAGDAELFLHAARHLGEREGVAIAETIAAYGLARHARSDRPWRSGIEGGRSHPSLMLGAAGTGHFYLRMIDPVRFDSVLMVTEDAAVGVSRPAISAAA